MYSLKIDVRIMVLFVVAFVVLEECSAIQCMKCNSRTDPLCSLSIGAMTKCPSEAVGCLTYRGAMPFPEKGTVIRDCAMYDSGTFCQHLPIKDSFTHSICIETCYKSNCNTEVGGLYPKNL